MKNTTTKVWYDHNTTTENGITMLHETCPQVTFRTELWLANDESSYTICNNLVTEYVEEVEDCGNLSDPDLNDLANLMLNAMKNHWGMHTPDGDDILEADWFEIAEGWFNDIMDEKGWS